MTTEPSDMRRGPAQIPLFIASPAIFSVSSRVDILRNATSRRRRPRVRTSLVQMRASQKSWSAKSSSALEQGDTQNRYVDLRTMKVIHWEDAHIAESPTRGSTFGAFHNSPRFMDAMKSGALAELLFTADTMPLSDSQQLVVQTLLSRRSVLYMSAAGEERDAIVLDVVLRNRLWHGSVVFCASCRSAADAMYAVLCAQLGADRRGEIMLDMGDGTRRGDASGADTPLNDARIIITLPHILRTNLVTCDTGGWVEHVNLVFMDNFDASTLPEWEEILLGMPSRIVLCMFARELNLGDREMLPLWIETIQNSVMPISPMGAASLLDRIERPQSFPMLRTFAYNAALHETPVQVSLTLLKDMIQKEFSSSTGDFVPTYSECLLHGIKMIPAEKPAELKFGSVEEAEYADLASLIVADAKRTEPIVRARTKRRAKTKRKERTASSRAAARRRREAAFADSLLLPAIFLTKGKQETENAAFAVQNALEEHGTLLWDDDSKEHLEELVEAFKESHRHELRDGDVDILDSLMSGIGIVHDGATPGIRPFVEELFRAGLISALAADTHLGSSELLALPRAKSVLVESEALAACDDSKKGLILASTAASLAGRTGVDDVGNLIALWYDESVDDEAAGYEIASTLLTPLFMDRSAGHADITKMLPTVGELKASTSARSRVSGSYRERSNNLSSSYDGILRSLRRFGVDGYRTILDHTLQSYKGWLERAALHATLEKVDAEKGLIDGQLDNHDWSTIKEHQQLESKFNEVSRVFEAMKNRYDSVMRERLLDELKSSSPGRIIGVVCRKDDDIRPSWEQKLLVGDAASVDASEDASAEKEVNSERSTVASDHTQMELQRENISAGVFVAILDQETNGKRVDPSEKWRVVVVLADGMWTLLPLSNVAAMTHSENDVVANVDLLLIPHPATFDEEPGTRWEKCRPIDESEQEAVYRISDALIARVAASDRPDLVRMEIPEFEAQKGRVEAARQLYEQSPWYEREDELFELRRLRRRSAELGDESVRLQKVERRLEEELFDVHNGHISNQTSVLAVLEDCHAVSVVTDQHMEMTPIGELASILPGKYPLFSAACLALIDDAAKLSPAEFAAFVCLVVCNGRVWRGDGDTGSPTGEAELDFSVISQPTGALAATNHAETIGSLDGILPQDIRVSVSEILDALHQLHRRHLDEAGEASISDIAPHTLDARTVRAVHSFAKGGSFREAADIVDDEGGFAGRALWCVREVLRIVVEGGEFAEEFRQVAREAAVCLERWPVKGDDVAELVDAGVVARKWQGDGYERWWRGVRERVVREFGEVVQGAEGVEEGVQAGVAEES